MVEYSKQTDANGLAEFELDYGDYTVTVSYDDMTVTQDVAFRKNHKNFPISVGKGTVTLTLKDSNENLLDGAGAILCKTDYVDFSNPDPDDVIAVGVTHYSGTCTLKEADNFTPTEVDAEIPFGTYYFTAISSDNMFLINMMLTVNQAEVESTIVLEPVPIATVTITCVDSEQNKLNGAYVSLNDDEWNDNADVDGVVTFINIPYSTFPLQASYVNGDVSIEYNGEITVDDTVVNETITLTEATFGG